MMDSMAQEKFMATVDLHTCGGQRWLTEECNKTCKGEECNKTCKGQEDKGEVFREIKYLKATVCGGED